MDARIDIPPCSTREIRALQDELGVSSPVAQVLARRGLGDPAVARSWLTADTSHDVRLFAGLDEAVALILRHVGDRSLITIHGDYDADGITSTAILLRALHRLGARVDHLLPSREADGYGVTAATIQRLVTRGTRLLITVDCGITAVDEVAAARAAGLDVVVTDHHQPRADGVLPDAPLVHPSVCGYPCHDLCAAGVAYKLAGALHAAAGGDPQEADEDLDLVALATVADCVPLQGENRRLVRDGLRALAATTKPGLRALMRIAQVDPGAIDATDIGFRLAPRINAAGRVARPDAALELLLTTDPERASAVAEELDRLNADRRHTETRILFDAERQVAAMGERPAYVLWGEDWHPGVIGIVASRLAERHGRPVLMVALKGTEGTGSGRSIPAFDLLAALDSCSEHLLRHGGHRAAAGCTVQADALERLRAAFEAHADAVLRPEDLVPVARVDAVVSGDELGLDLAEELTRLAPFGIGNPEPVLLVPAAKLVDPIPMGEGRHLRFTVESGGVRARAVAFGRSSLPDDHEVAVDATFGLELNTYNGAVEPRLLLRHATACAPAPITVVGESEDWRTATLEEASAGLRGFDEIPVDGPRRTVVDRRGGGIVGIIAALVGTGESVAVLCADTRSRHDALATRIGGFALMSDRAVERDPGLLDDFEHVVLVDPPADDALAAVLEGGPADLHAHRAWGEAELRFAGHVHQYLHALRDPLADTFRALRGGADLETALRGDGERPRHPVLAGRLLRVLDETGLAEVDRTTFTAVLRDVARVELEDSACFRACEARRNEASAWLTGRTHPLVAA